MEAREIYLFSRVEKEHFFYRARRDIVRVWLKKFFPAARPFVVEAGAGTGVFIDEVKDQADAVGSDIFFDPQVSLTEARLVRADARHLPFPGNIADATVALDVIEHLEDDQPAMEELSRITRPGGYVFINIPAFPLLWSDWDQAVGHKRRYKKERIVTLAQKAGLEIVTMRYINSLPFFPMLIYRWLRSALGIGKNNRLEDRLLPAWINFFFLKAFVFQGTHTWLSLPFGASLFAILRKRSGNN